jgi:hypothetical protein
MMSESWEDDHEVVKPKTLLTRWRESFNLAGFLISAVIFVVFWLAINQMNTIPLEERQVSVAWNDTPLIWSRESNREPATNRFEVGALPNDVCIVDGKPLILGTALVGYQFSSRPSISYIRNNGDFVVLEYSEYQPHESYWTGGTCPPKN